MRLMSLLRLVLADDEPAILSGLRDLFPWEEMGWKIDAVFSDGASCLAYMRTHPVEAVLTDIRMTGMDGLELAACLRRTQPDAAIVLMSAYTDFDYVQSAMRLGVKSYLTKPVKFDQLCEVFRKLRQELGDTPTPADPFRGYHPELISEIQRAVQADPACVTLESVSAQVGLSASHLSRVFHQYAGVTFSAYLQQCRMEKACELLRGSLPIVDVAYEVGYDSPKNFSLAFRQHSGMTPGEYRKLKKGM